MSQPNATTPQVEIFTGTYCSYCHRAKALLTRKGVQFSERDVAEAANRAEMTERLPAARTIPQVFIDGRHVGGFDDLNRLDMQGELDRMLGRTAG
jgi:glutaredoxin 3